jgi:hypothetical protein
VVGGLVDEVADVVDRRGKPVRVVAVERRDEGLVELVDDLVREAVAGVLVLLDPADQLFAVPRVAFEQLAESRDVDRVRGGAGQELEELLALYPGADAPGGDWSIRPVPGRCR